MNVAAVDKAESLHRFASASGYPLSTFLLVLKDAEAMELVEWYAKTLEGTNELFDLDLSIARRTLDPWPILQNFEVCGLKVAKASLVLN